MLTLSTCYFWMIWFFYIFCHQKYCTVVIQQLVYVFLTNIPMLILIFVSRNMFCKLTNVCLKLLKDQMHRTYCLWNVLAFTDQCICLLVKHSDLKCWVLCGAVQHLLFRHSFQNYHAYDISWIVDRMLILNLEYIFSIWKTNRLWSCVTLIASKKLKCDLCH